MTGPLDPTNRRASVFIAFMILATLCGCRASDSDEANSETSTVRNQPNSLRTAESGRTAALPAPEYFETLTEEAYNATPARLDYLIGQARAAAARDRPALSTEAAVLLDRRLAEIAAYRAELARADLALSSIELFRLFVASVPASEPVPAAVSLLDYAGFRYVADLKAEPVRWTDALAASAFAAARWREIEARVTDGPLRARFAESVSDMKAAVAARDFAAARQAGQRELDRVDELETFFARNPA